MKIPQLIIFRAAPLATPRDRDAASLQMLLAGLKGRPGPEITGRTEAGAISGDRWCVVLERFLVGEYDDAAIRDRDKVELRELLRLVEIDKTKVPGTETQWAEVLGRYLSDEYTHQGRPTNDVRDALIGQHYWLLRRVYPDLSENDCAEHVALVLKDSGQMLSDRRVLRIAKTRRNKVAALQWIDDQIRQLADHDARTVVDALLAQFEPKGTDLALLAQIFGPPKSQDVK